MIALPAVDDTGAWVLLTPVSSMAATNGVLTHPGLFGALASLAILSDLRPFPLPSPSRRPAMVFLSVCFSFAILLVWGLGWAIAVQALATVTASLRLRLRLERVVVLLAQFSLALFAAEVALWALHEPPLRTGQSMTSTDGLALATAAAAWFVMNYAVFVIWLRVRRADSWRKIFTPVLGYGMLGTGAVLVLAPLFVGAPTGWALPLLLIPVLAVSQLAWLYNEEARRLRYDLLTGLPSRQAFIERVEELAAEQNSDGAEPEGFALLVLDLDRLRQVNATLGHAVGSRLITASASRLSDNIRAADYLARLGGGEFAILQPGLADASAAMFFADHLAQVLATPAAIDGESIDIDVSIGVAMCPEHGRDSATLLRHAEAAMYQAKQRMATTAVYTVEDDRTTAKRWSLLTDLRRALQARQPGDELTFAYQPQVSLRTGELVGVEALLRWHHPDRGLVAVEDIFLAAEHSPIMSQLTKRVVDDVVAQVSDWNLAGLNQRASINVSARDLETPDLVDNIRKALRRNDTLAAQLTVEITETALMAEIQQAQNTLRRLADLGVAIALDDFGTGYSSMAHLRRLPVNEIKIDRSFTSRIADDPDDRAIVRSIIDLGHDLGLRVVAEGVEDEQTQRLLAQAGCDVIQGWLIARPMPSAQLPAWLESHGFASGGTLLTADPRSP